MKAAVKIGRERFEIQEVHMPETRDGDCLVKISYCSVCAWCYEEWLRDGSDNPMGPGITGHEVSGIIEKVGPNVVGWKPGDAVLVYNGWFCGKCTECKAGRETYCQKRHVIVGGYAEYISVPAVNLLKPPEGLKLKHAGLIPDMVGTSMHAIRRAFSLNMKRDVVTVWGAGPVGLFTVQGLKTFEGVKKVIILDPVKSRRDMALELGADITLNPLEKDVEARLLEENGGFGVNYAFCCLSSQNAIDMAYRTLMPDGYLMCVNGSVTTMPCCEKRVDASFYFFKNEYNENVRLVMEGKIRLEPVLTHEFPLDRINEAMELRSKHPEKALKINIKCNEGDLK